MQLQVAEHWYETLGIGADVTLIRETHVSPDLRCNIWHLRGRDRDLLIDSGLGVVSLRSAISALSERTVLAVASHTHFDHIGCHHEFEHRLCHPAEAPVLTLPGGANTVWSEYHPTMREAEVISALPFAGFSFAQYAIVPAPPSQLIDEGDELDLGNRLLRIFHMPGHSPGSICLYEKQTATLFTGDTLYDGELLDDLSTSQPELYLETLARLKEIPADTFHCGHYGSFGRQRMVQLIDDFTASRRAR
jgi:glyoxylase-like metal-dependent hydrolase (beta-lactamase superfamily II)